jgi:serine/threonine protein kinase
LVHGYLPFEDENDQNLYRKIKNACFTFKEEVSAEVKDLIRRILQPNPGIRYNIDSVMEHPWYFNYSGKLESGIIVNQQTIPIDDDIVRFCIKKYKLNE